MGILAVFRRDISDPNSEPGLACYPNQIRRRIEKPAGDNHELVAGCSRCMSYAKRLLFIFGTDILGLQYFLGSYTTLSIQLFGHVVWDVTRGQLTQHLGNHVDPLVDETVYGFSKELPSCEGKEKGPILA